MNPNAKPAIGKSALLGGSAIGLFFLGFGAWAALAPLDSAAVAPGHVAVEGSSKTIQHLEGGIVADILVAEGDRVRAGQPLFRLSRTAAESELALLSGRYLETEALLARLDAERRERPDMTFVPSNIVSDDPRMTAIVDGQKRILEGRRQALAEQKSIIEQQIAQLHEEIAGLEGLIIAQERQYALLAQEIEGVDGLVAKGMARLPDLLLLQRQQADVSGRRSENVAAIARARQRISEAQLRINELDRNRYSEITQEHRQAQAELFDLIEQIKAAQDVLARTEIFAPLSGVALDLQIHTVGGVIAPGEELLKIVPGDDKLVIWAEVAPDDVDIVSVGQSSRVMFSAYSQRDLAPVRGEVTSISADRLIHEETGEQYYLAKIEISDDWQSQLDDLTIVPGMRTEVFIVTGARTLLQYITDPLTRSIDRAFRES